MKIEKTNNPAAAGALVLVLVLIVGRIVWMLFLQNRAVSAASPAPSPVSAPTPAPAVVGAPAQTTPRAASSVPAPAATIVETTRNPFALVVPVTAKPDGAMRGVEAVSVGTVPPLPLPPFTIRVRKSGAGGPVSPLPGMGGPVPGGRGVSAQAAVPLPPEPDPVQALKLTALVDGTEPMAVVQTAHPEPVVLHVGDELEGMRVVAIDDHSVTFARGGRRWTLALQSAADVVAAGSAAVTSVAVPEEKSDEQQ